MQSREVQDCETLLSFQCLFIYTTKRSTTRLDTFHMANASEVVDIHVVISGSHALWTWGQIPTLMRNIRPPSSELNGYFRKQYVSLRNSWIFHQVFMALQPRTPTSTSSPSWEPQTLDSQTTLYLQAICISQPCPFNYANTVTKS